MKIMLSDENRLDLIMEAVFYCKKVKKLGMPVAAYSKSLREPIHFLWEIRNGQKYKIAKYRSRSSLTIGSGAGKLVYDHAIPFLYLQEKLLSSGEISRESLRETLDRYTVACIITKEEDKKLNALGLNRKMPKDWDQSDNLARYKYANIEIAPNASTGLL